VHRLQDETQARLTAAGVSQITGAYAQREGIMKKQSQGEQALREYKEAQEALRRRTAQLKALREERDRVASPPQVPAERKRAKKTTERNVGRLAQ
jgi:hypothetical protein